MHAEILVGRQAIVGRVEGSAPAGYSEHPIVGRKPHIPASVPGDRPDLNLRHRSVHRFSVNPSVSKPAQLALACANQDAAIVIKIKTSDRGVGEPVLKIVISEFVVSEAAQSVISSDPKTAGFVRTKRCYVVIAQSILRRMDSEVPVLEAAQSTSVG